MSKTSRTRRFISFGAILFPLLSLSCSSSSGSEVFVRFVNALIDAPSLDFMVDRTVEAENINQTQASGFIEVDSGAQRIRVTAPGLVVPLLDETERFDTDTVYSFFAVRSLADPDLFIQRDSKRSRTRPDSDQFRFRVIVVAPDVPDVDLYVARPTDALGNLVPAAQSLQFRSVTPYFDIDQGTYRFLITRENTKEVLFDSGEIIFDKRNLYTLTIFSGTATQLRGTLLNDET